MKWQETSNGKRKLWLNEHGICRDCGQRDVEPGTQLCFECAERKYKKNREYYKKNEEKIKQQVRERSRRKYAERKAAGICVKCGKRNSVQGKTICIDCLTKIHRKKDPRWNNEIERTERPNYGLCYVCGKSLNLHKSLCDECLDRARKSIALLNQNPTDGMVENREYWKKSMSRR